MNKLESRELVPELRFPEFIASQEWRLTTFGEEAIFINGKAYKQDELLDKGKYRVLRVGNFFTNKEWYYSDLELDKDKYCNDGDLLYAWSASFGPRIWSGEKVIYHYHIWKVVEKEGVDKNFLYAILDFETEKMKAQSANGLGLLHITKGAIENWKCTFPKQKEQKKIADCLSSMDDLIAENAKKLDLLKLHKKGLMQKLFPEEGKSVPELRFSGFNEGWKKKPFSKLFEIGSGKDHKHLTDGEIPVYGSGGYMRSVSDYLYEGKSACIGRKGTINRPMLLDGKFWTVDTLFYTHSFKNCIPEFVYLLFQNIDWLKLNEAGGIPSLSKVIINKIEVLIPEEDEQQRIVDCVSSLDELIKIESNKIEALKEYKKGLMQKLFPEVKEFIA
ncbi:restriction endonuclease subunit S [Vibrio harveyi]|uniref:restriction endonuclease subunit S n=1 Tax=Vibrio harveyi TaxID=669 RepID=UPI00237FEB69|nr:restriction endonuclease subunit S [Vibrio harveyi]